MIDFFVEYLDQTDALACDDEIVVVLVVLDHHVVLRPVHQVEHVSLPFSSAIILPSQQLPWMQCSLEFAHQQWMTPLTDKQFSGRLLVVDFPED